LFGRNITEMANFPVILRKVLSGGGTLSSFWTSSKVLPLLRLKMGGPPFSGMTLGIT
jgi:hypothetical protein